MAVTLVPGLAAVVWLLARSRRAQEAGTGATGTPGETESIRRPGPAVRFSVIVPAYREAGRIGETVAALRRTALAGVKADGGAEIVVVDDGSDDGTAAAAGSCRCRRRGGARRRTGARARRCGPGCGPLPDRSWPSPMPTSPTRRTSSSRLLEEVERGADVVVGDRRHPDSVAVTDPSWLRGAGSRTVAVVRRLLRLSPGRDTQCGLKAFSREAALSLAGASVMDRFSMDVEILWLSDRLGMDVRELPVEVVNSGSRPRSGSSATVGSWCSTCAASGCGPCWAATRASPAGRWRWPTSTPSSRPTTSAGSWDPRSTPKRASPSERPSEVTGAIGARPVWWSAATCAPTAPSCLRPSAGARLRPAST